MTIVTMAHPLGLHLEAVGDWNEGCDFALIGLEIVGMHGLVLLFVLSETGADFIKTFFGSVKPPLEVLDLLVVLLVAFVKGLEETINEAPQVFGSHFKNGQCSGHGSWGEGECEGGSILGLFDWWWYG